MTFEKYFSTDCLERLAEDISEMHAVPVENINFVYNGAQVFRI